MGQKRTFLMILEDFNGFLTFIGFVILARCRRELKNNYRNCLTKSF